VQKEDGITGPNVKQMKKPWLREQPGLSESI
jgi:hypothetical protein